MIVVSGQRYTLGVAFTISLIIIVSTSVSSADAIIQEGWGFDKYPYLLEEEGIIVYRNTLWAGNGVYDCINSNTTVSVVNMNSTADKLFITACELHDDGYAYSFKVGTTGGGTTIDPANERLIKYSTGLTDPNPTGKVMTLHVEANHKVEIQVNNTSFSPKITDSFTTVTSLDEWSDAWFDNDWATCPTTYSTTGDKDGDGICDIWEKQDVLNNKGLVIFYPGVNGTNPPYIYNGTEGFNPSLPDWEKKDVYLEIDWMDKQAPYDAALTNVINAFKNAPVDCDTNGANCKGVNLHIQKSDTLKEEPNMRWNGYNFGGYEGFFQKKAYWFGDTEDRERADWETLGWKQKKQVFRYSIFMHSLLNDPSTGIAEMPGNDFALALGNSGCGNRGCLDQQEGTLMHELGHTLNLNHGGSDGFNCKPNYISVMSYSRQMSDIIHSRALDYSRHYVGTMSNPVNGTLTDANLQPSKGLNYYGPSGVNQTVWGLSGVPTFGYTGSSNMDWLGGNATGQRDILKLTSDGLTICPAQDTGVLTSQNDWQTLMYDVRGTGGWGNGRITAVDNSTISALKFPEDASGYDDPLLPGHMGINTAPSFGTKYSEYTVATNEMNNSTIIGARLVPLTILDNFIQKLTPNKFVDPSKASQIKAAYSASINDAKEHIKNNKMINSMGKLDGIRNTFDGVDIKDADHKKIITSVKSISKLLTESKKSQATTKLDSLYSDVNSLSKYGENKNSLLKLINSTKDSINTNDITKAKNALNSLDSRYAKMPSVKVNDFDIQNLETDLIVDEDAQKRLQSLLDGATLSHYKGSYYYEVECPNCVVEPPTESCGELTIYGAGGNVDVPYCISGGYIESATYISPGTAVTLDIKNTSPDSWVKLGANKMIDTANSTPDLLTVEVDGDPTPFKTAKNHGVKWITIPLDANSKQVVISGPHVIPEFGTVAILVLAVAIVSIIAVSARTRLGMAPKYN